MSKTATTIHLERSTNISVRMNTPEHKQFLSQLNDFDVPTDIGEWLFLQMSKRWGVRYPTVESKNNTDPDDWEIMAIEATIELCRFRPPWEELMIASKGLKFDKFIDFAILVAILRKSRPPVGDEVVRICPYKYNALTRDLWQELCKLTPYDYNDQFVIKCYLNKSLLYRIHHAETSFARLQNFFGRSFFWVNSWGAKTALMQYGYKFLSISNLNDYAAKEGDVIRVVKKSNSERFKLFALVSEVTDSRIGQLQFKPALNSPLQATLEGFDLFFFRDPETHVEGVWTKQ